MLFFGFAVVAQENETTDRKPGHTNENKFKLTNVDELDIKFLFLLYVYFFAKCYYYVFGMMPKHSVAVRSVSF